MDYLVDLYTKKPDLLNKLFDKSVNISLKVDGSAFQISNEDGNVQYHKRGGSSNKLGPVIDEYTQLFSKQLNKAMKYFSPSNEMAWKEVLNNKFLAIELLEGGTYVLLNAIDNNDNLINAGPGLVEIADGLGIVSVPLLYDGILNDFQKENLMTMLTLSEDTSNEDFKNILLGTFKIHKSYQELLNKEEIEGIVLTWNLDDKIAQYKIINPSFKVRHNTEQKKKEEQAEKDKDNIEALIKLLTDKLEKDGEKLDSNNLKNLELNFLKFISEPKFLNKLINISAKVRPNDNKFFFLQKDRLSKEMKDVLKKHGTPIITAYEQYLMTFNKERKRNYIIDKEFQERINKIIQSFKEES